jgi:hypothetical protein
MAQPKRYYNPSKANPATPPAKPVGAVPVVKPATGTPVTAVKKATAYQPLSFLFTKENYLWMGIGAGVIVLGMLLMMGGKNENLNTFDYNVVYSTTRVTIAPILILAGLMIEVYAIFKTPKQKETASE